MLSYNSFELYQILLALVLLLSSSYAGRKLADFFHAPRFVGELGAGIILGPSLLSYFIPQFPELFSAPGVRHACALFQEMGLLLLMYGSGLKLSKNFLASERALVLKLFAWGICLPMAAGLGLGVSMYSQWSLPQVSASVFGLFLGLSMAITSIPVISKILGDLGLLKTNFARIVLATAVLEDMFLFVVLSIIFSLPFQFNFFALSAWPQLFQWHYLLAWITPLLFFFLCWNVGQWAQKYARTQKIFYHPWAQGIPFHLITLTSVVLLGLALNVPSFLSSFGAGLLAQHFRQENIHEAERFALERFSMSFFIPLYFCLIGFKLDLRQHFSWQELLVLLLVGQLAKMLAIWPATSSLPKLRSELMWALNARGGPGIVIAGLALSSGLITESLAASLVLVAVISSLAAGLWLRQRRDKILAAQ